MLLQYHLHIPGPDPLTNADTEERQRYYDVDSTPSVFFNGKSGAKGGGSKDAAGGKYDAFVDLINPLLEKKAKAELKATATQKGNKIEITGSVENLEKPDNKIRLQFVLVEESVKYQGRNKMDAHHYVVRDLPGGAKGFALKEKSAKHTASVDLDDLRKKLTSYLDGYAKERPFPNKDRPLELEASCASWHWCRTTRPRRSCKRRRWRSRAARAASDQFCATNDKASRERERPEDCAVPPVAHAPGPKVTASHPFSPSSAGRRPGRSCEGLRGRLTHLALLRAEPFPGGLRVEGLAQARHRRLGLRADDRQRFGGEAAHVEVRILDRLDQRRQHRFALAVHFPQRQRRLDPAGQAALILQHRVEHRHRLPCLGTDTAQRPTSPSWRMLAAPASRVRISVGTAARLRVRSGPAPRPPRPGRSARPA